MTVAQKNELRYKDFIASTVNIPELLRETILRETLVNRRGDLEISSGSQKRHIPGEASLAAFFCRVASTICRLRPVVQGKRMRISVIALHTHE